MRERGATIALFAVFAGLAIFIIAAYLIEGQNPAHVVSLNEPETYQCVWRKQTLPEGELEIRECFEEEWGHICTNSVDDRGPFTHCTTYGQANEWFIEWMQKKLQPTTP